MYPLITHISGYIKNFHNGGKNMSFKIEGDNILVKYNKNWNKIKKTLNIKFHCLFMMKNT